jgi:aconitase A
VHCDHLVQAKVGAAIDLRTAMDTNKEVYDFLASISNKYASDSGEQCRHHPPGGVGKLCFSGV